jgi:hypothetical protein
MTADLQNLLPGTGAKLVMTMTVNFAPVPVQQVPESSCLNVLDMTDFTFDDSVAQQDETHTEAATRNGSQVDCNCHHQFGSRALLRLPIVCDPNGRQFCR